MHPQFLAYVEEVSRTFHKHATSWRSSYCSGTVVFTQKSQGLLLIGCEAWTWYRPEKSILWNFCIYTSSAIFAQNSIEQVLIVLRIGVRRENFQGIYTKYAMMAVVDHIRGRCIGLIMPCLMSTRGLVASWKVSEVDHSGPMGWRRDLSYCCLFSKGCGSCVAMYFTF
jgi:hypothetical protein